MSKSPEDRDWIRVLSGLAASAPARRQASLPGEVGTFAEKACARWSAKTSPSPESQVVAVRVRDEQGRPRRGASVSQAGVSRRPARTSASGIALVELDRALGANLLVECDGQKLGGALDSSTSDVRRIGAAKGVVVDARVVQLGEAAFPIEQPDSQGRRLRVAVSGTAEHLAEAVPVFDQLGGFELRVVFASAPTGEAEWAKGRDVRPFDELTSSSLEEIDLLVDLSGDERVRELRNAPKGKNRRPTFVLSIPHHHVSVLKVLARRFARPHDDFRGRDALG